MPEIIIYSSAHCSFCTQAKMLLDRKHAAYTEIRVDLNDKERDHMIKLSGRRTVPQIFINGQHIGGCDDLYALEQAGELDTLLQGK